MAQEQSRSPPPAEAAAVKTGETSPPITLRRSSRVRKRPSDQNEDAEDVKGASTTSFATPSAQRNPKRRATPEAFDVPDNLLEASLAPWKENEQSECASWVEVESDPVSRASFARRQRVLLIRRQALFTAILSLLGVKGARIEEVLSVDEDSLMALS
jgi:ubiquitin carboxyl-terminal hydrolase L5